MMFTMVVGAAAAFGGAAAMLALATEPDSALAPQLAVAVFVIGCACVCCILRAFCGTCLILIVVITAVLVIFWHAGCS